MLAHDLRNHLTPLQRRLDLSRRRAMREGRGEYLRDSEHAVRTVDRLRRLIDDLLANAVGHSAQGGVVRVEVSKTTRPVVTPRSG